MNEFLSSLSAGDIAAALTIVACTFAAGVAFGIALVRRPGGRGSRRADFPPRSVITRI